LKINQNSKEAYGPNVSHLGVHYRTPQLPRARRAWLCSSQHLSAMSPPHHRPTQSPPTLSPREIKPKEKSPFACPTLTKPLYQPTSPHQPSPFAADIEQHSLSSHRVPVLVASRRPTRPRELPRRPPFLLREPGRRPAISRHRPAPPRLHEHPIGPPLFSDM
jgi:hypothetical protein